MAEAEAATVGCVDGFRRGRFEGWAWRPAEPDTQVRIDIVLDGLIIGKGVANEFRADLRAAGVGHGRYAFKIPLEMIGRRSGVVDVVVQGADGAALSGGAIKLNLESVAVDKTTPALRTFVDAVVGAQWDRATPKYDKALAAIAARVRTARPKYSKALNVIAARVRTARAETLARIRNLPRRTRGLVREAASELELIGQGLTPVFKAPIPGLAPTNFFLKSKTAGGGLPTFGPYAVDFGSLMTAFAACLASLGKVTIVDEPGHNINALNAANLGRGENSVLLFFGPLAETPVGLSCPVVPVLAWAYPDPMPPTTAGADPALNALRRCGRAIALSDLAAQAIRSAVGEPFTLASIAPPVWDRVPQLHLTPLPARGGPTTFSTKGLVFDTRTDDVVGQLRNGAEPAARKPGDLLTTLKLDGVVFTSEMAGVVFPSEISAEEGLKNWLDLVSAFLAAFREIRGATLVLDLGPDPVFWRDRLANAISRAPSFVCRVILLHGGLEPTERQKLIGATHWVVNPSSAEAECRSQIEFMCAGRPSITPIHSAMLDFINADNALVVHSDEDFGEWPNEPHLPMTAVRHRIYWSALSTSLFEGYRVVTEEWDRFTAMSVAARSAVRELTSDRTIAAKLQAFFAQDDAGARPAERQAADIGAGR